MHPDLLVALSLVQDGDRWFRPEEGWVEVIRLHRNEEGGPRLIEIRSEFLRDYLAARDMDLYCSSYRERIVVSKGRPGLPWTNDRFKEAIGRDRREGLITEGEYPHPTDHFWTRGVLWRTEWVDGGTSSTRVRGDADPHVSTFALGNDGSRVAAPALAGARSWLYFDAGVVATLLRHRGARLRWATQETGLVGATGPGVHFGLNDLGLVTVFAKDIGQLAPWEQRLWAAHNMTPDGGVSKELFASQMEVNPAATTAPESRLADALERLGRAFEARHGSRLLRRHDAVTDLVGRAHRFRAVERDGVLELAKELTRIFAERVDVDAVLKAIGWKKGEAKLGSMKAIERLVALHRTPEEAATTMAPLFGIYDLRLADAHLGSGRIESGLIRARVDSAAPPAMQGRQLLQSFVETLEEISSALDDAAGTHT